MSQYSSSVPSRPRMLSNSDSESCSLCRLKKILCLRKRVLLPDSFSGTALLKKLPIVVDFEAAVFQTNGDAPQGWDPDIRIEKIPNVTPKKGKRIGAHHDCPPDIGLSIRAFISTRTATEHTVVTEYSGEYVGHSQSKTVFKLQCQGEVFDGCILKVRQAKQDLEPSVFAQVQEFSLIRNSATGL